MSQTTTPRLFKGLPLVALAGLLAPLASCGDDAVCGIDVESQSLIIGVLGTEDIEWNNWRSSPNNDCGEMGGPVSLTVEADQNTTTRGLTLCLPRPDKLSAMPVDVTDASLVRVIDIFADVAGANCLASLDRTAAPSGTLAFPGICDDGQHTDGYNIVFDISVPMTITCDQDSRSETMVFSATTAVAATPTP